MIYLKEGNVPLNAAYDDEIVQEANGTYQLTFKFPTNSQQFTTLKEEALLLADDLHGEQEFIIFEIVNNHGYCTVYANQVVSLLNGYSISTLSVDRVSGTSVMSALSGSIVRRNNFSFYSDIQEFHTLNLKNVSVMDALAKDQHSIIGQWGGDLVRDKYDVRLLKNGGSENESLFMYKKNMRTYKQSKSIKELRTRIHFRKKLDDDKEISVTVDSPLIGQYKNIYEYDMEVSDQDVVDVNILREYGRRYYKETLCDIVENSIELDVVNPDTNLKMFDVVSIYHERFDLDIRKKISKYKYSPMGKRLKSIGFGKVQQGLSSTISGMVNTQVAQQTKYLVNDVNTRVEKEIKNADLMFDRKVEKFKEDFDLGLNQAATQIEIIRAETNAKLRDNLRQFEKQVSDISAHFNDTIGQYGTVIEENQTKIEQTTNELTGIRQSVANLSGDILKKSELEITPDRITFGAGKVVDGRTIASLVSVSPEATNIISDTVTITGNQYNLVDKDKREVYIAPAQNGTRLTQEYHTELKEDDAFLVEGEYSASIPVTLTYVLWAKHPDGTTSSKYLSKVANNSTRGSYSSEFKMGEFKKPVTSFWVSLYQDQQPYRNVSLKNTKIIRKTTSNLLVDGSITAQKIAANSIETAHLTAGAVTAEILSANAVTADKLKVDTAMVNKLSANDALINNLVAKTAFINKVKSIDIDAARITSGVLRATNGAMSMNLNSARMDFNKSATINFNDNGNAIVRRVGDVTGFLHFHNATAGGTYVGLGVTSHNTGIKSQDTGNFAGIRIFRSSHTVDQTEIYGDKILMSHAFNAAATLTIDFSKLGRGIELIDILRNIRENLLLLHNHKDGAGYSYNIYNI